MSTDPLPGRLVLLGHPVAHSLSPTFQQAALDHCGIPLRYEALDLLAEDLTPTLRRLAEERAAGNVTLPYKGDVAIGCARLSDVAERAQAVNTFWTDSAGALNGDNTDVGGFLLAAERLMGRSLDRANVVLLGSGGSAAGVVEALRQRAEVQLIVHARNPFHSHRLATSIPGGRATDRSERQLIDALHTAHLVVNATSIGIEQHDFVPMPPSLVPQQCAALDLTYRRVGLTTWVQGLRALNRNADDGIAMLLEQGALAFERWFGIEAPRSVMARALGR